MDKKKLSVIGAVAIGVAGVGLRFMRVNARIARQESQRVAVSQAQSIQSALGSSTTGTVNRSASSVIKSIAQNAANQTGSSASVKYDKYTPVNGVYSLGQIGNNFYVVDVATKQQTPLDNVTQAYVVVLDNRDNENNQNGENIYQIIVGKRGANWYVFGQEANVLADLEQADITSKTRKLTIKDEKVTVE